MAYLSHYPTLVLVVSLSLFSCVQTLDKQGHTSTAQNQSPTQIQAPSAASVRGTTGVSRARAVAPLYVVPVTPPIVE